MEFLINERGFVCRRKKHGFTFYHELFKFNIEYFCKSRHIVLDVESWILWFIFRKLYNSFSKIKEMSGTYVLVQVCVNQQ